MKAMLSHSPGGPETLQWSELPVPEPAPGQVVVRIHAAGVNFPDTLIIRALYQIQPPRPFAPGGEIAGEGIATGAGVTGLQPGDRVLALTLHGGFATHIALDAGQAVKIPDAMPYTDAAGFIFTYGTSHHALKDRAALQPDETVLILGAAGGVGAAAIELAKASGATVIAAVSSEEKATFCRSLGADHTILYARDMDRAAQKAFGSEIKALSGKAGIDVVYDAVGGTYAEPALRVMAWQGRYLVVGFPAGIPSIPLNLPLLKGCQIIGVFWGAAVQRDPEGHARDMAELFDLYQHGKIRPRISQTLDLQQAPAALRLIEERRAMGKIVLTCP
jgi:NADPH2:quinone reductase